MKYTCTNCNIDFNRSLRNTHKTLKFGMNLFCSKECSYKYKIKTKTYKCVYCGKDFNKRPKQTQKYCSRSCSVTYNNLNKTKGYRRSKLEKWIEKNLIQLYPKLEILFNNKTIINSELDIYIPSMKLAFELNGIFHYKNIYGQDKFEKIQNNDNKKLEICKNLQIKLYVIDISNQKHFTEKTSTQFLSIITNIINKSTSKEI